MPAATPTATARFASWPDLIAALDAGAGKKLCVLLDEFPYLVGVAAELPSVLQHYLDSPGPKKLSFLVCGSAQRMMQGLVLDRAAPLYGRAREVLKIDPLAPGWIPTALGLEGASAIEAYAVWGGVPRYLELARDFRSLAAAVRELVLDRRGVLHAEPSSLLLDDHRTPGQIYSLLSLIGGGCKRLSEIAGRMNKPAGSLTRPLADLIDVGYVRRETPFSDPARGGKRTLYRIDDPFLAFYFRFVQPHRSLLELGAVDPVAELVAQQLDAHVAGIWEVLTRRSVPFLSIGGTRWGAASRWWGAGAQGERMKLDVVAESLDHKSVLLGEAKWSNSARSAAKALAALRARAAVAPFIRGRRVVLALWTRRELEGEGDVPVISPGQVLDALR